MFKRGKLKKEIPYDEEDVKEYITKLFTIEQEINVLKEDCRGLKEEYKGKVDQKLVSSIIRLVKTKLKLNCSEQTKEDLEKLILEKINMIVS